MVDKPGATTMEQVAEVQAQKQARRVRIAPGDSRGDARPHCRWEITTIARLAAWATVVPSPKFDLLLSRSNSRSIGSASRTSTKEGPESPAT